MKLDILDIYTAYLSALFSLPASPHNLKLF
ncbi:hypothetical protein NEOC95_001936 [Neochlamydia sp. AcF95]|nr:hypothetical protein [Neochlamydia sp. AcF95]